MAADGRAAVAAVDDEVVAVVLTTHETEEAAMVQAIGAIESLDSVREKPCMIRIEAL